MRHLFTVLQTQILPPLLSRLQENAIKLEEMVATIMEMRAKESKEAKEAAKNAEAYEYVKEIYVMGEQVAKKKLLYF